MSVETGLAGWPRRGGWRSLAELLAEVLATLRSARPAPRQLVLNLWPEGGAR